MKSKKHYALYYYTSFQKYFENYFLVKRRNEVTNKGSTPPFKKVSKTIQDEENPNSSNSNIGVSLQNLTKIFSISGKEKRVAVNDLSLDFHVGEVTALLGHNGAGKSTMM